MHGGAKAPLWVTLAAMVMEFVFDLTQPIRHRIGSFLVRIYFRVRWIRPKSNRAKRNKRKGIVQRCKVPYSRRESVPLHPWQLVGIRAIFIDIQPKSFKIPTLTFVTTTGVILLSLLQTRSPWPFWPWRVGHRLQRAQYRSPTPREV